MKFEQSGKLDWQRRGRISAFINMICQQVCMRHNNHTIRDMFYINKNVMACYYEFWTSLLNLIFLGINSFTTPCVECHGHSNEVQTSLFFENTHILPHLSLHKISYLPPLMFQPNCCTIKQQAIGISNHITNKYTK